MKKVVLKLKRIIGFQEKTQSWLSDVTGIRPATIVQLCNNSAKTIRFDYIEKICNALDCTPGDWILLTDEVEKEIKG